MKLYHGSPVPNICELVPNKDIFGDHLVYFSSKRENVLPYLSNPVAKYYQENNLQVSNEPHKFSSYAIKNGILEFQEFYPNAIYETYKGVSGYVYKTESYEIFRRKNMPFVYVSTMSMGNLTCEFIDDAYAEILRLEKLGLVKTKPYKDNTKEDLRWIKNTITREYRKFALDKNYIKFLSEKFPFLKDKNNEIENSHF